MLTQVKSADDAIQMFNENLEGLLSGKRKIPLAKQVSNDIGKICAVKKMELIYRDQIGNRAPMKWFGLDNDMIYIEEAKPLKTIPGKLKKAK